MAQAPSAWRPFRLDHGRGQPSPVPSLASLARDCRPRADRCHRSSRLDLEGDLEPSRCGAGALAGSGARRFALRHHAAAGLALSARAALQPILHSAQTRGRIARGAAGSRIIKSLERTARTAGGRREDVPRMSSPAGQGSRRRVPLRQARWPVMSHRALQPRPSPSKLSQTARSPRPSTPRQRA